MITVGLIAVPSLQLMLRSASNALRIATTLAQQPTRSSSRRGLLMGAIWQRWKARVPGCASRAVRPIPKTGRSERRTG